MYGRANFSFSFVYYKLLYFNFISVKALFITIVASTSAVISFSYALTSTKKRDNIYDNAVVKLHETGSQLAIKALKWGTFYALTGCGCIIFGIWKLANVKNVSFEFSYIIMSIH